MCIRDRFEGDHRRWYQHWNEIKGSRDTQARGSQERWSAERYHSTMTKVAIAIETVSAFLAAELETRKDSGLKAYIAEAGRAVKAFATIAKAAREAQVQS